MPGFTLVKLKAAYYYSKKQSELFLNKTTIVTSNGYNEQKTWSVGKYNCNKYQLIIKSALGCQEKHTMLLLGHRLK